MDLIYRQTASITNSYVAMFYTNKTAYTAAFRTVFANNFSLYTLSIFVGFNDKYRHKYMWKLLDI